MATIRAEYKRCRYPSDDPLAEAMKETLPCVLEKGGEAEGGTCKGCTFKG